MQKPYSSFLSIVTKEAFSTDDLVRLTPEKLAEAEKKLENLLSEVERHNFC